MVLFSIDTFEFVNGARMVQTKLFTRKPCCCVEHLVLVLHVSNVLDV